MNKEKMSQKVGIVQKKAEEEIKKLEQKFSQAGTKIKAFVKKNPEKAAAISAGIGAAVGAALAMLLKGKGKK